ncbi:MAG: 3'-5' exonuclease [Neisseria sp.]|nr:3'-5' exonuclease [Neisseria sp.]
MSEVLHYPALSALFARFRRPVVLIDLETTGGHFLQDRITEAAFLRFDNGKTERFQQLVNPQTEISEFITRLTGIDNAMVADAPDFSTLAPELLGKLQGALIVAHNSKFDYQFLCNEFARAGLPFAAQTLCTVQLSRRLYPQFHKHSLESIIERHGISTAARHRAMDDVLALADFLEFALGEYGTDAVEKQARLLLNPQAFPENLPEPLHAALNRLPDSDGVSVWLDNEGRALHIAAHLQAFREAAALTAKPNAPLRRAATLVFHPSAGAIDSLVIKALLQEEYARPSEYSDNDAVQAKKAADKTYFAVHFAAEQTAEGKALRARIVPLSDGLSEQQTYGLFLHKKAAKAALREWAEAYGLCQKLLDILPYTLPENSPCPAAQSGKNCHCTGSGGRELQYRDTAAFADRLPVAGWGQAREIRVHEALPFGTRRARHLLKHGLLQLPDGRFLFDSSLPALVKEALKEKRNVETVS